MTNLLLKQLLLGQLSLLITKLLVTNVTFHYYLPEGKANLKRKSNTDLNAFIVTDNPP